MVSKGFPLISILIPIRNEATYIERCLDAVLGQDYPPERLEILIADGQSDDGTREILQRYEEFYAQCQGKVKMSYCLAKLKCPNWAHEQAFR